MFIELLLLILTAIVFIAYTYYKRTQNLCAYFDERNLKYKSGLAGLQSFYSILFNKIDAFELSQSFYDAFPDESIYGVLDSTIRQYAVRDPEVYKKIAIKDFDHFEDHRAIFNENMDELFGNSLISMHGEKWRQMRATLSPAFTGSKMRQMFELVSECADEIVKYFQKKSANGEKINIEMKDFFSRYTNDVIATCAFGIKVNSYADPNNDFYANGKKILNFGGFFKTLKFFAIIIFPKITRGLKLKFFDPLVSNFFKNMILDTMKMRQNNKIHRPDMINMLMKVREGNLEQHNDEKIQEGFATVDESDVGKFTVIRKWNDNEIVAQCFLFFLAGFETSSTMLTFVAHELIVNADVQQKLYEEIAEVNERLGGTRITYDALQKMKYLDQVICEVLRKWPPATQTDRNCVKDYIYDDGKLKFKIEKGSNVIFPVYGIQHDPKYFPNPDKFDPERFNDENKHNIVPGTYVPFGVGPRNCIGSRFALMKMKAILYYLLLNFSFKSNKDTQIPLKMKKVPFQILTEKGVHLELKPRLN
ncbi:probable cytochrome P450 9f2 [Contarinia nasturtii]|uniref:probable cytochrome P450 9f2 n=1 Tax=Contarinia nasturtii TaxID=265458 RepID=UPI0012D49B77|nr:probable cytochrome P450 9f2 [Contarinia nasturtii]